MQRCGILADQMQELDVPGLALDQGADCGTVVGADDEIAFLTLLVLPDRLNLGDRWPSGSGYG